jgi:hypothetical protein
MYSSKNVLIPKIKYFDETRKYFNISQNREDFNHSLSIKDKNSTNYFKMKSTNLKTVKINNNLNIFNSYNSLSNSSQNKLYNNTITPKDDLFQKKIKIKINKNKNILLTSLYNLPQVGNNNNTINIKHYYSSQNIRNKSNKLNIDNSKSIDNSFQMKKSKTKNVGSGSKIIDEKEILKLENYMRDKFYEDIEKKMIIKLKSKNFCHDKSIKERIIKMNKIGLFWGTVFEYCNPILSVKKFRLIKNKFHKNDLYMNDYKFKSNKEIKPILYTNNLVNEMRREEKLTKEFLFKNKYSKYIINKNKFS